jgi:CBS domain containing-hemolysin-like protein
MIDARGHAFEDLGHRFTVVDATARRIKWVRVEPIQPPAADARLGNSGEFRGLLTQE